MQGGDKPGSGDQAPKSGSKGDDAPVDPQQAARARRASFSIDERALLPRWEAYVDLVIDPIERLIATKVRRWVHDIRTEVLAQLNDAVPRQIEWASMRVRAAGDRKWRVTRDLVNRLLQNEQEWGDRVANAVSPLYKDAAEKSLTRVAAEVRQLPVQVMDVGDPRVALFLEDKEILVRGISDTVRDQLREKLIETTIEAATPSEIHKAVADVVKDVFANANTRAQTIARSEAGQAAGGVRFLAFEDLKERAGSRVKKHKWLTANDLHVRNSHDEINGTTVEIGDLFGNGLHHPCEQGAPPEEVINCRCTTVIVIEKK